MQLFYYKDPEGNFGDDLNPWLWNQLLPGFFDDSEDEWFVGIGTLLNQKLPKTGKKYIFGSGYGYGKVPHIDDTFHFLSVRGPKTAEILGIDSSLAITDAAILIQAVYSPPQVDSKPFKFGFVPHCQSVRNYHWEQLCEPLGFKYISVEWEVAEVLSAMNDCEILICEAMHGAIVADALRIPWIPVSAYGYIDRFKWEDWLTTLSIPYNPLPVTSQFDLERSMSFKELAKNRVKRLLKHAGLWNQNWSSPEPGNTGQREFDKALKELEFSSTTTPCLSSDQINAELLEKYSALLDIFQQEHRK